MKTIYKKLLLFVLFLPFSMLSQGTLSGTVLEKSSGQPLPGVNVVIQGSSTGVSTDFDGKFSLPGVNTGDNVVFSYVGYADQVVAYTGQQDITISLEESANMIGEVVVQVGYGAVRKKDATGSVAVVTTEDFNKGPITSADQLLTGRTPGVRITNAGGQPDAAPNIRIRGGASLSAQNNPLIVIDGVPLDFVTPAGVANPLSLVNPNDLESFSILKDASATAIYGSRASNGVIIITTKRGTLGKPQFNYSSIVSWGQPLTKINVMRRKDFVRFINEYHPTYTNLLGIDDPSTDAVDDLSTPDVIEGRILYNTDWFEAVTRSAWVSDQNFSVRANLFKKLPIRASVGYTKNEGLVKTNDLERYTASIKLTPSLLDDHLKVEVNAKGVWVDRNAFDDGGSGVLAGALSMDPTKPIYAPTDINNFGGYYQNTNPTNPQQFDGEWNPVNKLLERRRPEMVNKILGNVMLDYSMHFLPELHAVVNAGLEASRANIEEKFGQYAFAAYTLDNTTGDYNFRPGTNFRETQHITNRTLDAYLTYTKNMEGFVTKIDAQAGHTYQSFVNDGYKTNYEYDNRTDDGDPANGERQEVINPLNPNNRYYNKTVLESYFGRLNVDLKDRYLFTFTMRADGSSLFSEDNRWGYFPAAAFAWRVKEESFLKESKVFNDLKVRLGYGVTGQQDITSVGYYPYTAYFAPGGANGQYLPGVNTYSQLAYNPTLTWEKTETMNAGIDFSFMQNDRISGSVDVYKRFTEDLLVNGPLPPGQLLTNEYFQNVGSTESTGIEMSLAVRPVVTDNITWEVAGNIAYNYAEVTDLKDITQIITGPSLPVGTGARWQRHALGFQPGSGWMFEQLYDNNGHPIVGAFRDRNGDGAITNDDRYYVPITPNWTFGWSTNFNYKNWDVSATFHGQLDGKVYNAIKLRQGWTDSARPNNTNSLTNVLNFYDGAADPNFFNVAGNIQFSDYYLEDAAFMRCDNITIGYKFPEIMKNVSLRVFAGVNNAFILTDYSGQDPENFGGQDNNFYPRPRMYNFGVNLDF